MKKQKIIKLSFQISLFAIALVLVFVLISSITKPIIFKNAQGERYKQVVVKLKDIRKAQTAYKKANGVYTASFDTLIDFMKNGKLIIIKEVGSVPEAYLDELGFEKGTAKALEEGLIKRDKLEVPALTQTFEEDYPIDKLGDIPSVQGATFVMGAGKIKTGSGVVVKVFEAYVINDVYLKDLDDELVRNLTDDAKRNGKFPGLKVGSLVKANNNAGNWE